MAVYTDVAAEELAEFLKSYDIGELLSYKGIAEGVENSNFLMHTSKGAFILTLYEKRVAPQVDALVVVGAPNSSNSRRLQEVAERAGCRYSVLVQRAADIDWSKFDDIKTLGVTAGASAPEVLVEEILDAFAARFTLNVETVSGADESGMFFPLPRQLRDHAAA